MRPESILACHNGHPYTPENRDRYRRCRVCGREAKARSRAAARAAAGTVPRQVSSRAAAGPNPRLVEDQRRRDGVAAGIEAGLTRSEIADRLGIGHSALSSWAGRRDVELPGGRPWLRRAERGPVEPVDPAEAHILGDRGWVRCGVHGDVPRTGPLRLTSPHNQGRLARIAELHAHCHETHDDDQEEEVAS